MSNRCGYCREYGHDKRKCNTLKAEVETIRRYVPGELWRIHNAMVNNGFGLGAIVELSDWNGETVNAIIDSTLFGYANTFVEYRQIKYSKRVRTILKNMSGQYVSGMEGRYLENVSYRPADEFSFLCFNPSNPSHRTHGIVLSDQLGFGERPKYFWGTPAVLLSPSYDSDTTLDDYTKLTIRLHDRLLIGREESYVTGLA